MPPDYTHDNALYGKGELLSFGDADFRVARIPKPEADKIMREGHYSKSVAWSSSVHLGVYAGTLVGVLQFGPGMNPASGASVVEGTRPEQWLELNRMWLSETAPDQSASRAISYAVKYIRRARPQVGWIQSFADERCGKLGAVYQACSFAYLGEHESTFYLLDGEWYHKSMLNRPDVDKRGWGSGPKIARFKAGAERAVPHTFRQFRYFRALKPWAEKNLMFEKLPYPKPGSAP